MQEILFKAKAINRDKGFHTTNYKNGDWVYGLVTQLYDERFENLPAKMTNTDGIRNIEVDYKTISQYTGLTDKNGKKIFEGDIAQGNAFGSIWQGEIVWIDEIAGFGIRYFHRSDPTAWENSSILKAMKYKKDIFAAEVIGNIHDNPELLKEADNE